MPSVYNANKRTSLPILVSLFVFALVPAAFAAKPVALLQRLPFLLFVALLRVAR